MMPSVSIIIPFHEAITIKKSIKSVLSQESSHSYEIIAVDNSQTGIAITGLPHNVRYIREKRVGSYRARNAGIRVSKGQFIVFLDSDCIVKSDWLDNLISGFESKDVLAVGGSIVGYNPRGSLEKFCSMFMHDQARYFKKGVFATANLAVRSSAFKEIGLFDERLSSGGDFELCSRFHNKRVLYRPNAVVMHQYSGSLIEFIRKHFIYGWWQSVVWRKYGKRFVFRRQNYLFFIIEHGIAFTFLRVCQDISYHFGKIFSALHHKDII